MIDPIVFAISPFVAGWLLILEFIFTMAMALKCYPLQPGGLLAPLIRLSYIKMLWMALPCTIVLSIVGTIAIAAEF